MKFSTFLIAIVALTGSACTASATASGVASTDLQEDKGHHRRVQNGPPDWVIAQLPAQAMKAFKSRNDLKQSSRPHIQSIPPKSKAVDVDGDSISLQQEDLIPLDILSNNAVFSTNGIEDSYIPGIFRSKSYTDVIVTIGPDGKLVSASKNSDGRRVKVVPVSPTSNAYATIIPEDVDNEKLAQFTLAEAVPTPNQRHLRMATHKALGSTVGENRELAASCSTIKVVEVGIYFDYYFCQAEGFSATAARDRALAILKDASVEYEVFCKKLVIKDLFGACDAASDFMKPYVDGTTNSIAENSVLVEFRSKLAAGGSNVPTGDIVHFFSGKVYPNTGRTIGQAYLSSVCYGNGYNSGINEMTSFTRNDMLFAHESGHNNGADHDSGIMGASLCGSCGNLDFTTVSQNEINAVVDQASCVGDETVTPNMPTPAPTAAPAPPTVCADNANWPGYFGGNVYTCAWLALYWNPGGICAAYPVFRAECPNTCNQC